MEDIQEIEPEKDVGENQIETERPGIRKLPRARPPIVQQAPPLLQKEAGADVLVNTVKLTSDSSQLKSQKSPTRRKLVSPDPYGSSLGNSPRSSTRTVSEDDTILLKRSNVRRRISRNRSMVVKSGSRETPNSPSSPVTEDLFNNDSSNLGTKSISTLDNSEITRNTTQPMSMSRPYTYIPRQFFTRQIGRVFGRGKQKSKKANAVAAPQAPSTAVQGSVNNLRKYSVDANKISMHYHRDVPLNWQGRSFIEARQPLNHPRNRYINILAYDQTRIPLKLQPPDSNYINANYVNTYTSVKSRAHLLDTTQIAYITKDLAKSDCLRYLCTQGPLQDTRAAFWAMVHQENSRLIVMVTELEQRGRTKCTKYWPTKDNPLYFENIHGIPLDEGMKIEFVSEESRQSAYKVRQFKVKIGHQPSYTVTHVQYVKWPDHGVPTEMNAFLSFLQEISELRQQLDSEAGMKLPVTIHCSAGVGRTGVTILVETAMRQVMDNLEVDFRAIFEQLRAQRSTMVQTMEQYIFAMKAFITWYDRRT